MVTLRRLRLLLLGALLWQLLQLPGYVQFTRFRLLMVLLLWGLLLPELWAGISFLVPSTEGSKMAVNLKLAHATDFTGIEQQFLTLWNALQDAGNGQLAFDLLFAGLNLEHFVSTLDHDPAKRTAEEQTIRDQLNATFQALVAQANAALNGVVVSK